MYPSVGLDIPCMCFFFFLSFFFFSFRFVSFCFPVVVVFFLGGGFLAFLTSSPSLPIAVNSMSYPGSLIFFKLNQIKSNQSVLITSPHPQPKNENQ